MFGVADVKRGPWHVEPDANGRDGFYSVCWWKDDAGVGCEVAGRIGEREFAELMAAAPELKEGLQEAVDFIGAALDTETGPELTDFIVNNGPEVEEKLSNILQEV